MKKKLLTFITFALYFFVFAFIGFFAAKVAFKGNDDIGLLLLIGYFIEITIASYIHIILHEAGHLLGGLWTGYSFVSFRIGSIVWVKNKQGKIEKRKMKLKGTAGQCLMCPPDVNDENFPYVIYNLMGSLTNIILGVITFGLMYIFRNHTIASALLTFFGITGFLLGITNLLPVAMGGANTDGCNIVDLKKNPSARSSFKNVLTLNALMSVADDFNDIPQKTIDELLVKDFSKLDITVPLIANEMLFKAEFLYARKEYEKAYETYMTIAETENVLGMISNEAKCECLFFEIMKHEPKEVIEKRYSNELKYYVNTTISYPSRLRLMYAYYLLYEKNEKKAAEYMQKLEKSINTHQIKAEALLELDVAKEIKGLSEVKAW